MDSPSDPNQDSNTPTQPSEGTDTSATVPVADGTQPGTEQLTGQPAAANSSTPTPEPGGMKEFLKKNWWMVLILVIAIIGGLVAYFIFSGTKKSEAKDNTPEQTAEETAEDAEASASAQEAAELLTPLCIAGYRPFISEKFSICYPNTMIKKEVAEEKDEEVKPTSEGEAEENKNGEEFVFEDEVETLTVLTDFKENLNKNNCLSSKIVNVGGFQAQRNILKLPSRTGCSSTIVSYATLVNSGNEKPVFYISLSKKNGSYLSDNSRFVTIESTFRINQLDQ